jgi:flagellar basal-body rod protein FlgF
MENSLLVTLSAQAGLRRQLDVVANNLANMNTTGFKRERVMFESFLPREETAPRADTGRPVFVRDVATVADHQAGRLETTGNPLDLAVRGDGYFVIQGPDGTAYSRNGHFRLDDRGQLVTEDGLSVEGEGGAPVIVEQSSGPIVVAADGTVSAGGGELGRLRIVRFDAPQALRPAGAGMWITDEAAKDVERPAVVQGMLERSNVTPIEEIETLIRVHRAYDQAKSFVDREDERIRKMLQTYAG